MTDKKVVDYILARHRGHGCREAGRRAGYASAPPGSAEKLYQRVEQLLEVPEMVELTDQLVEQQEQKLEELRRQKRAAEVVKHLNLTQCAGV